MSLLSFYIVKFSQATKLSAHPLLVLGSVNLCYGDITGRRLRNMLDMTFPIWLLQHLSNANVFMSVSPLFLSACPTWHTVHFLCVPNSAELQFDSAAAAGVMATDQSWAQTAGVWSLFNRDLIWQSMRRSVLGPCSVPVLCLLSTGRSDLKPTKAQGF